MTGSLNRREDEFETKRDWDDFLEFREQIIMDLVLRIDVDKREKELEKYAAANIDSIKANEALERKEVLAFRQQQTSNEESARLRHEALIREDEERRKDREVEQNDIVNRLASGKTSVDDIIRESKAKQKPGAQRSKGARPQDVPATEPAMPVIKGLKQRKAPEPEKPYDPFMGMRFERDYFELHSDYPVQRLAKSKKDSRTLAGGYEFSSYYDETLVKAFAGLGCFIEDEVSQRQQPTSREVATTAAMQSGLDGSLMSKAADDVF